MLNLAISATEHGLTPTKRFVLHRKEGTGAAVTPTQERSNSFQFRKDWKELERIGTFADKPKGDGWAEGKG